MGCWESHQMLKGKNLENNFYFQEFFYFSFLIKSGQKPVIKKSGQCQCSTNLIYFSAQATFRCSKYPYSLGSIKGCSKIWFAQCSINLVRPVYKDLVRPVSKNLVRPVSKNLVRPVSKYLTNASVIAIRVRAAKGRNGL